MLRIARLTDRSGRYYLADLADELGAAELRLGRVRGERPPGRWAGTGAAGLGLSGPVEPGHLAAVLSGDHPHLGHPLRRHQASVAGYDLVFAAPKSVSVLFGLGDGALAAAALEAHRVAVEAAVDYVARHAAGVRIGSGEDRRTHPVRGVVAARFDHGVSRALDPHLHTHVVLANMGQDNDGRWRALDGRGLDAHGHAAGALYDAHLRHELTARTGSSWVRRHSGAYELAAVDPLVAGALSRRQAEIRQHLHFQPEPPEWARTATAPSRRARSVAWAATREAKAGPGERTPLELRRHWHRRAVDVGWREVDLARAFSELGPAMAAAAPTTVVDEHRFAASLLDGTLHAGVTRRDVLAAWAKAVAPGAQAGDIERCVDALAPWGAAVGVAEPAHAFSEVVPSPQLLRALGPRPAAPGALAVWQSAASEVDRARRHARAAGVGELVPGAAGGTGRAELSRLPVDQLAVRIRLERVVAEARLRLGRERTPARRDAGRSVGRG